MRVFTFSVLNLTCKMKLRQFSLLLYVTVNFSCVTGMRPIDKNIRNDAFFFNFMVDLINRFQNVAQTPGQDQFATLVMVSQQERLTWDVQYQPVDQQGLPLNYLDGMSPGVGHHLVNYICARPRGQQHSELRILPFIQDLFQGFQQTYHEDPVAIILYSRICPCSTCTDEITQMFNHIRSDFSPDIELAVIYTSDDRRNANHTWEQLTASSIAFFRFLETCRHTPQNSRPPHKRSLSDQQQVEDCLPLQSYLLSKLGNSLECCVSTTRPQQATADLINRLVADCFLRLDQLEACLVEAAKKYLGGFCSCASGYVVTAWISKYMKQAVEYTSSNHELRFLSHPLDPYDLTRTMSPITDKRELQCFHLKTVTYECKDKRQEGLMCSYWKSKYLSAGNSICKDDSPCDKYGHDYSWCYLEAGSWDYCCTGLCKRGTCESGSYSRNCTGDIGHITTGNTVCKPESPCGFHSYHLLSFYPYNFSYVWCYTNFGWEYCCEDTAIQSKGKETCKSGTTFQNYGRYDKDQGLATTNGIDCLSNHQCGRHGWYRDKYWCYTNSTKAWDYCRSPDNK